MMKYTLAIGALAAVVSAVAAPKDFKIEKRQSAFNTVSALGVLETALPSSLVQLANSNPGAASSVIASEFATGATPTWFSALPSDIRTYLVPASVAAAATSAPTNATAAAVPGVTPPRPSMGASLPYGTNGTAGGVAGQGTAGTAGGAGGSSTAGSGLGMGGTSTTSGMGSSSTAGSGSGGSGGGGSAGSGSAGSASRSSTGGVPAATAVWGMGVAGVAAVAGLIAL